MTPLVCAHRGASAHHPDNSLAAFAAAIEAGADMIETDLRRGRDGGIVLAHDPPGAGETPLPLEALLAVARGRIRLDLELKEPGLERDLLGALVPADRTGLVVTSFLPEVVATCRALDPALDLGLLVEEPAPDDLAAAARACGAAFLCPEDVLLERARPAAAALGRGLSVWTVNDPAALARLARDPDVAIVTTDDPALARRIFTRMSPSGDARDGPAR